MQSTYPSLLSVTLTWIGYPAFPQLLTWIGYPAFPAQLLTWIGYPAFPAQLLTWIGYPMKIADIFENYTTLIDTEISTAGWVKTCRDQKQMIFIHLSDGTSQSPLQIIAIDPDSMAKLSPVTTGSSIYVKGKLVSSPAKGQLIELMASDALIYQICPTSYPFQKVGLPMEFMRMYPHLRHRTNLMRAIFSCKSVITNAIHHFFVDRKYCHIDLPILTSNACEGGCQPLQVTSLLNGDTVHGPISIDYTKDFFNKPVYLTVSNQLHLE